MDTIVRSVRMPVDLDERIERIIKQTGITRSQVINRVLYNGIEHMEGMITKAQDPVFRLGMRLAIELAGSEEEIERVNAELDEIAERRRQFKQEKLPGMER